MVSDQKFGMSKRKALAILERMRRGDPVSPSDLKAVCEIAIEYIGRCPDCLGSGQQEMLVKPNGPYTQKTTASGVIRYFVTCKFCEGQKTKLTVYCNSCGSTEELSWDAKSNKYCKKCTEALKRKGLL
jgi:hypothetical protein